jgi:glycosyltransferase involved in cell wall biosynthesis
MGGGSRLDSGSESIRPFVTPNHFCVGLFPELLATGGIQRAGRHMAAVLAGMAARQDATYRFLSLNDPAGEHRSKVEGIEFRFTGFECSKTRFLLAARAAGRPRLIFVAHPNLAPVGWLLQKRSGAGMAVVAWGIEVWEPLAARRRWALQAADAILAISHYTAEKVVEIQGVAPSRVQILPLALDPSFLASLGETALTNGLPAKYPRGRIILSVTRLAASEGYKGIDTVIQALPRLRSAVPDVKYVVIGDGDDRPRLEQLSREAGIGDCVHFVGRLDGASPELRACYRNCDVFVLPSKGEGFGLVFLEAMAYGKPVVGGAHGGALDVIEDGKTGFLVPHGDVPGLAGALEKLLIDAELRRRLGEQGRARVLSQFCFDSFQARLERIVAEMCAAKS